MNQFPFNMNDGFDRHFKQVQKRQTGLFRFAFGVWLLWACVCLAGAAGIVYVVWHFVSKFW